MQLYLLQVGWLSGISFFVAFLLTFWPSRLRLRIAAVLWMVGVLAVTGLSAYSMFLQGSMAHAFAPQGRLPIFAWLVPLLWLLLTLVECLLLLPIVSQPTALRAGKFLFLIVVPVFMVVIALPGWRYGGAHFPIGIEWLGYPLLWFRIRERFGEE